MNLDGLRQVSEHVYLDKENQQVIVTVSSSERTDDDKEMFSYYMEKGYDPAIITKPKRTKIDTSKLSYKEKPLRNWTKDDVKIYIHDNYSEKEANNIIEELDIDNKKLRFPSIRKTFKDKYMK